MCDNEMRHAQKPCNKEIALRGNALMDRNVKAFPHSVASPK